MELDDWLERAEPADSATVQLDLRANAECNGRLGLARWTHDVYRRYLNGRVRWLRDGDHAEAVLLYAILQAIIRARELRPDARPDLPSAQSLRAALISPSADEDAAAAAQLLHHAAELDDDVEAAANVVIRVLESQEFLAELDDMAAVDCHLSLLAQLAESLAESVAGRRYLRRTVGRRLDGSAGRPAPAFHISRLSGYDADFRRLLDAEPADGPSGPGVGDVSAASSAVATTFLKIAEHVLPTWLATVEITELEPVVVPHGAAFFSKFYRIEELDLPAGSGIASWGQVTTGDDLQLVVHEIRRFNIRHPSRLEHLRGGAASLALIVTSFETGLKLRKAVDDPSVSNVAGVTTALMGTGVAVVETSATVARMFGQELSDTAVVRLSAQVGTGLAYVEAALQTAYAIHELTEGDELAAVGHLSVGAGNLAFVAAAKAGGASLASIAGGGGAGTVLGLGPWGWAAAGAVLLVGGIVLLAFTEDDPPHPLVDAFEQTYFGVGWKDWKPPLPHPATVAVEDEDGNVREVLAEDHDVTTFNYAWKRPTGLADRAGSPPNLGRQVSAMLQLVYPIRILECRTGERDGQPSVTTKIEAALLHPDCYVEIRLFSHGASWTFVLPGAHENSTLEGAIQRGWFAGMVGVDPAGGSRERRWECTVRVNELIRETARWVEVAVSPPTKVKRELLDAFDDELPDELAAHLAIAPRQRRVLDKEDG